MVRNEQKKISTSSSPEVGLVDTILQSILPTLDVTDHENEISETGMTFQVSLQFQRLISQLCSDTVHIPMKSIIFATQVTTLPVGTYHTNTGVPEKITNFEIYKILNLLPLLVTVRPPLWSSGQSSWLQIQRSGFDS
jgi:hypothetical protein